MQRKRAGMIHKIDILNKYMDVQAWLKVLAYKSYKEYLFITHQAKAKTAECFKITFSSIDELTKLEIEYFNKQQETLLIYYFEYMREHRSFRKLCSLS